MKKKDIITEYEKINPLNTDFLSIFDSPKKPRKTTNHRKRFADKRYFTVDTGGASFLNPNEELNYNLDKNYYGVNQR